MEEPKTSPALLRPCSLPHSAPVEWLEEVTKPYLPREDQPAMTPEMVKPPAFVRHDGWTGEKMAIFCEALAETAVVAEACERANMGISGAYACRRRNPVFAAAWDAALTIARERLADTLLARSMEGNIEQIWKDGEVVGERHLLDNRLGLAILRRLDRLAEMGIATSTIGQRVTLRHEPRPTPACNLQPIDWNLAIDALRTGDEAAVAKALALFEGDKVDEVEAPPNPGSDGDNEPEEIDFSHRFWVNDEHAGLSGGESGPRHECGGRVWMTDFPPPSGFTGYESCDWGDPDHEYERECTPHEVAVLEADATRAREAARAEEEALRDTWLALLRSDCGLDPSFPASIGDPAEKRKTGSGLIELADEPVEGLGNSLVHAEGEAVEQPADHAAP